MRTLIIFSLLVFIYNSSFSQADKSFLSQQRAFDSLKYLLKSSPNLNTANKKPLNPSVFTTNPPAYIKRSNEKNIQVSKRINSAYCYDTSSRFFLADDNITYYVGKTIKCKDGNLLTSGAYHINSDFSSGSGGFLMNTDEYGNVLWAKKYDSVGHKNYSIISYLWVLELGDGSILLAGYTSNSITENNDIILTRTDNTGNIIWNKIYKSRLWGHGNGGASYFNFQDIRQDSITGDLYFIGNHFYQGTALTKVDVNNGNILWSNLYTIFNNTGHDTPFGLEINKDEIITFNKYSNGTDSFIGIYRIDKPSGDTLGTSFFVIDDTAALKLGFFWTNPPKKLTNGNYVLTGTQNDSFFSTDEVTPIYQAGIIEFSKNFEFVKAYSLRNKVKSNVLNTLVTVHPDGTGLFTMLQYISGYKGILYSVQFNNEQITKQRKRITVNEGMPAVDDAIKASNGADLTVRLIGDSVLNNSKIEFLKLQISDTGSACLGYDDTATFIQPYKLRTSYPLMLDSIRNNIFIENPNKTITVSNTSLRLDPGCKVISYCDTIALRASKDTICLGEELMLTIHKNAACGSIPYFDFDTSKVRSFTTVNDTTFKILFKNEWAGRISVSINSCINLKDSVNIVVLKAPTRLNLGADSVICPGNSITLNAGHGFKTYTWMDGSTDSIYTATSPGIYFVEATDACGGKFRDTILITDHPPIPLDIGKDTTICMGDAITISAPDEFIHYTWSSTGGFIDSLQKDIVVLPTQTTKYKLKAEKQPGCFAYDSITVNVVGLPKINLGKDTSLCAGESLTLDAGENFDTYTWSTGETKQTIAISTAGIYHIDAIKNGCHSSDTLSVISILPKPTFTLGNDTVLCSGQQIRYSYSFSDASYLWSDGNVENVRYISDQGIYWLNINQNECLFSDTVKITSIPAPSVDLGLDTVLCDGEIKLLTAYNEGAGYKWQDGSSSQEYIVRNPGQYYVKVTALNNCQTNDTINVAYKHLPVFSFGDDMMICKGSEIMLAPNLSNVSNFLWQNGSTSSSLKVSSDGIYWLTASNECGSFTDSIRVSTFICRLSMPSAFTPNNDNMNDIFRVKYVFPVKYFKMQVFNRWGQIIYSTNNIKSGWDGNVNSMPSPSGIYIWVISLIDLGGKRQDSKGAVTLIR